MDLTDTQCEVVDWIELYQNMVQWLTLVSMVMNSMANKSRTGIGWFSKY
jgi:hypothetical protein